MTNGTMLAGGRRKDAGRRDPFDFDPTPPEAVTAFVAAERTALAGHRIWEPAAGDGRMVDALIGGGCTVIAGSDVIDRAAGRFPLANFLDAPLPDGCTAIITNPPFNQAEKFIRRALADHHIPYLALLLKAQFWHAATRLGLHNRFPPTACLPLTWRLDFRGGGAPVMDCNWFVWDARHVGTFRHQPLPKPTTRAAAVADLLAAQPPSTPAPKRPRHG
ncbi:MAG: SAM-dependent DNA methyltransferase [Alphaproteobacteria bacterium]|nr:SAM-dependent DNA methyltransferase [Alphaproteobacteria bacterium]